MYKFASGNFMKAGKLFLPYGLRIEDDSAFIRQATGMNFDNSDHGVEFALDYTNTTVNFFVSNILIVILMCAKINKHVIPS
jgi:hypothetical protein